MFNANFPCLVVNKLHPICTHTNIMYLNSCQNCRRAQTVPGSINTWWQGSQCQFCFLVWFWFCRLAVDHQRCLLNVVSSRLFSLALLSPILEFSRVHHGAASVGRRRSGADAELLPEPSAMFCSLSLRYGHRKSLLKCHLGLGNENILRSENENKKQLITGNILLLTKLSS